MHTQISELAPHVQRALKAAGYGARDIEVVPALEIAGQVYANKGARGFVTILNLDTGERRSVIGSWGGSNMFVRSPVDDGDETIHIPPNGAVIKGSTGYPRTFATLYAHPEAFGRYLPSGEEAETLTPEEAQGLYCFWAIKGGEYRRDELRRRGVTSAAVDSLVDRGYLKRNRAGAVQITTKGKNARTVRN